MKHTNTNWSHISHCRWAFITPTCRTANRQFTSHRSVKMIKESSLFSEWLVKLSDWRGAVNEQFSHPVHMCDQLPHVKAQRGFFAKELTANRHTGRKGRRLWWETRLRTLWKGAEPTARSAAGLPWWTYATHTPGMQAGPQTWPSLESSVSSSGTHSHLPPCAATERIRRLGRQLP